MKKIFIASPLGFAESTRLFLPRLSETLQRLGYDPVDPWSLSADLESELRAANALEDRAEREASLHRLALAMAERNAAHLRTSDGVLAVLDGSDVDSGTASEIGYAFGLGGKVIHGYRGDFRRAGEHDGVQVNLQVQYWIEMSGGRIIHSLNEVADLTF